MSQGDQNNHHREILKRELDTPMVTRREKEKDVSRDIEKGARPGAKSNLTNASRTHDLGIDLLNPLQSLALPTELW